MEVEWLVMVDWEEEGGDSEGVGRQAVAAHGDWELGIWPYRS